MVLVFYKVIVLVELDVEGINGKNIVENVNIFFYDELNNFVILYDDENYINGVMFKLMDVNGVVVFYVEEGEYEE